MPFDRFRPVTDEARLLAEVRDLLLSIHRAVSHGQDPLCVKCQTTTSLCRCETDDMDSSDT